MAVEKPLENLKKEFDKELLIKAKKTSILYTATSKESKR